MRMSELAATAGVPVPTVKFYLREGLLPEGRRTSATQAVYGDDHVRRLRVIRSLLDAGVTLAEARRVLTALDDPPPGYALLEVAHSAVIPPPDVDLDTTTAESLAGRLGWEPDRCDPAVLHELARALTTLERAEFTPPAAVMDAYIASVRAIAEAEIDGIPSDSPEAAVRYVVLGTVLNEPLLLALRRVAEQIVSWERFAGAPAGDIGAVEVSRSET